MVYKLEDVEKFWDSASAFYREKQWEKSNIALFDYSLTKNFLLKYLRPKKTEKILEIGCGPGKWTNIVSGRCNEITAVDISRNMINEAKSYCEADNISFIHGDIMKINIAGKFDKIYAVRSLEYIKDKEDFIRKMRKLLKDKGKIFIITKTNPCLWDMKKNVKGFSQQKISHKRLSRLLKKHLFNDIIIRPAIIRLPIFANGNREFKIIRDKKERKALAFFKKLTIKVHENKLWLFLMPFSESYIIHAEK